jgi:hypothetical protein
MWLDSAYFMGKFMAVVLLALRRICFQSRRICMPGTVRWISPPQNITLYFRANQRVFACPCAPALTSFEQPALYPEQHAPCLIIT